MQQTQPIQPWFLSTILSGLQSFMVLGLDGTPGSDGVAPMAAVWARDLWGSRGWDSRRDSAAIEAAFQRLRLEALRWPQMAEFRAALDAQKPVAQFHKPAQIEWDKHRPENMSTNARAHVVFNCLRMKLAVPEWAYPAGDPICEVIQARVKEIAAEQDFVKERRAWLGEAA